jgi:pimeloyl-ACP methyl ester carboxylesterase
MDGVKDQPVEGVRIRAVAKSGKKHSFITAPALLIRADPALGTTLDEAAWEQAKRLLPAGSRAVQIDGATHNVHRSTFNAFMQVVNDFLSKEKDR